MKRENAVAKEWCPSSASWDRSSSSSVLVHLYADRVVFDAGAFSARAAASPEDPRVAFFVAERIADEIVAQRRDLVAFRSVLVGTACVIVA